MIILYDTDTFDIMMIVPGAEAEMESEWDTNKPANSRVFTPTDDGDVLQDPNNYWVEEIATVPTNLVLKDRVTLTPDITPMNLSDIPTVTVQRTDFGGTPIAVAGIVINLSTDIGLISAISITTDSGGAGTITYKAAKSMGNGRITAYAPKHFPMSLLIPINIPSTSEEQNWLEGNDIKSGAISGAKLAAFGISHGSIGLTSKVNSVVVDGDDLYAIGFSGASETTPAINRVDHKWGRWPTADIATYTQNGLTNGYDDMFDDGTRVWFSAGTRLKGLIKSTFTIDKDWNIDDAGGGSLQFVAPDPDGTHIWSFLKGGTSGNANKVLKIDKTTGGITSAIDISGLGGSVIDRKAAAIHTPTVGTAGTEPSLFFNASLTTVMWYRIRLSDNVTGTSNAALNGDYKNAIAADDKVIWAGGVDGLKYDGEMVFATGFGIFAEVPNTEIGTVYDLHYDGEYVWALTDTPTTSVPRYLRQFSRRLDYEVSKNDQVSYIERGAIIDLGPNFSSVIIQPHAITSVGDFVVTGNYQVAEGASTPRANYSKARVRR